MHSFPFHKSVASESIQGISGACKTISKIGPHGIWCPAAHIAMMQQEVVNKRRWFTEQHYQDLIGATNLIPGPNSTEMAIHIGHERAGWKGLIVAGFCFILPAVFITGFFAWLYKKYGQFPEVQPLFMSKESINDWRTILTALTSLVLTFGFKKLNSAWIVLFGSLAGYLLTFV